jgi:molybdenum-dependent DNA-binding transcriptional regulator ModE
VASKDERDMDALADLVARQGSIARAARTLKMSSFRAQALWMQICAGLGEQAR